MMSSDNEISSGAPSVTCSIHRRIRCKRALNQFTQQKLPACKPVLTTASVISIFLVVGVAFIPTGFITLRASQKVIEIVERYDADCVPSEYRNNKVAYIQDSSIPKNCSRTLKLRVSHRSGWVVSLHLNVLKESQKLVTEPSWRSDREHKFGKDVYPFNFQNGTFIGGGTLDPNIPLSDQEDLLVWMRTAALPNFRKLYGRIEEDLQPDDFIEINLLNNYNMYSFSGKKTLVLSTSSWLGGQNDFLGVAYFFVGCSEKSEVGTIFRSALFPQHGRAEIQIGQFYDIP